MVGLTINGGSATYTGTQSFDFVTISNGGILYVGSSSGSSLILNVTGDVNIASGCSIIADARGYAGGAGGSAAFTTEGGYGGSTASGVQGGAKGTSGAYSSGSFWTGGGGGGGGSYGSVGGAGGNGGNYASYVGGVGGSPGVIFGTQTGTDIDMGAGAGGSGRCYYLGTAGSAGGGSLTINANNIYIYGTVSTNGGAGGSGGGGNGGSGGGGGGSGGGILLKSNNIMNLSGATIRANGGAGGAGTNNGTAGGTGGGGRIKIFYGTTYTAPTTLSAGTTYVAQLTGSGSFSSNPSGATIWIDGSNTGVTTNNTVSNIVTGGHNYTLKLTGYADVSGSFSVSANITTTVPTVTFPGSASITSLPTGARIYLAVSPNSPTDQGITTPSTITNLTAASSGATTVWNYRLTLPSGYADATGSFTATAGQTISAPVTFPPSVSFTSNPTNARIWIDSVDKGLNTPSTITGLTAGTRNYRLVLTGYADATGSFTATGGTTTVVPTVTFAPSAIFATTPSGASIYIDNNLQGINTPVTITGLSAGNHTYKLFLAGYNAITGNFNTTAGQTTNIPTILLSGTAMAFLSAGD